MPKVTSYTRSHIESFYNQGSRPVEIFKELTKEGLKVSFASIMQIIKKIQQTGSTKNLHRSGRPKEISEEAKAFIEDQMRKNEATSSQIQKKLAKRGIVVNSSTVTISDKLKVQIKSHINPWHAGVTIKQNCFVVTRFLTNLFFNHA